MGKATILIVEDDEDIQQLVSYNLIKSGLHVTCADTGEEGLQKLQPGGIDCILLDLMLPGMSGLEVCRAIKKNESCEGIPILILTAKGEEDDVVTGLECGADDYVTKPFSPKVLIARVKALLRRRAEQLVESAPAEKVEKIIISGLEIHPGRHEVKLNGAPLQLTMTEYGVLLLLASKPGWVYTRQQIIDAVRGYDFLVTPRAIDVQVFGLRKKMGEAGSSIETVRGVGYRFKA
ncbi:MAG: response regulator transcription factor [Proteobacteria bacterium]|nr:response regulator transcription factor [Pseudomonadota bacterium]MBU4295340.1 response regulator transcription factor [Pseudomonadota bacterium]MCG2748196.1 response regulator transcription factor [Desulfobulbaceae bacterium]